MDNSPSFSYELKLPKERIAVLIGKSGQVKKELEEATGMKLEIDSTEGDVLLKGSNPVLLYSLKEVVHAVGRGFNPDVALLLLKQDYALDLIDLKEHLPTQNALIRIKGRIIGTAGKTRRYIEEMTNTSICVYGKTVGIIGEALDVVNARHALELLLAGSPHSVVYRWLEKTRRSNREH
ncbi:RNA-processing protein [Candidatus Woesearchaeota archaeon]|nr:RNA-processing protein [Candidatus Woesearchaeota archaeon]